MLRVQDVAHAQDLPVSLEFGRQIGLWEVEPVGTGALLVSCQRGCSHTGEVFGKVMCGNWSRMVDMRNAQSNYENGVIMRPRDGVQNGRVPRVTVPGGGYFSSL